MSDDWIDCEIRLPPIGHTVEVKGDHTPPSVAYPRAWRTRRYGRGECWDSREWRGTVGIRYWRAINELASEPLRRQRAS